MSEQVEKNEFHHLFQHKNGTFYFQQYNLGKKCLSTKDPQEAKNLRDKILDCFNSQQNGNKEEMISTILKLIPQKNKKRSLKKKKEPFETTGIKKKTIYETSDGKTFHTLKEASDYEVGFYIMQQIQNLFSDNDTKTFAQKISDIIIKSTDKADRLSIIIKEAIRRKNVCP